MFLIRKKNNSVINIFHLFVLRTDYFNTTRYCHTTFEYKFLYTRIPKSSIQNPVFIEYSILIGCFLSLSTNIVLKSFMTVKSMMFLNCYNAFIFALSVFVMIHRG